MTNDTIDEVATLCRENNSDLHEAIRRALNIRNRFQDAVDRQFALLKLLKEMAPDRRRAVLAVLRKEA